MPQSRPARPPRTAKTRQAYVPEAAKPRSLIAEVGIIVLGVLIALTAQQTAEWLTWRDRARDAHANLAGDAERVVSWLAGREAQSPCIDARLYELSVIVDAAAASGRKPAIGPIGAPTANPWTLPTWEVLTFGQTLTHLPRDEVRDVSRLNLYLEYMRLARDAEVADYALINSLIGPPRPFSSVEEAQIRAALSDARSRAIAMRAGVTNIAPYVDGVGWLTKDRMDAAWRNGLAQGRGSLICQPLGAPAPTQSPLSAPPRETWPPAA